ncbi:MAG: acylphosphatase [Treponema sp.]|jgi:acylphosphatase|nr:acylphosphatase [Treponema sp.]
MAETAFFAHIAGRVQGVGFRYACQDTARTLGLSGWVRNTADGDVEVWSEGDEKKQTVFLKWLRRGPPYAKVESVTATPQKPTGAYKEFFIKFY